MTANGRPESEQLVVSVVGAEKATSTQSGTKVTAAQLAGSSSPLAPERAEATTPPPISRRR